MEQALQEHTDFVTYIELYEHKIMPFTLVNATEASLRNYEGTLNALTRNGSFTVVIGRTFLKHGNNLIN